MKKANACERRRHPRCQAKTGTFVILGDDDRAVGHIFDIGQEGISFFCEAVDNAAASLEATIIGYYENIGPVSIRNIPLESITNETGDESPDRIRMRFGHLTPSQRAKLSSFLWLNANAGNESSSQSWA